MNKKLAQIIKKGIPIPTAHGIIFVPALPVGMCRRSSIMQRQSNMAKWKRKVFKHTLWNPRNAGVIEGFIKDGLIELSNGGHRAEYCMQEFGEDYTLPALIDTSTRTDEVRSLDFVTSNTPMLVGVQINHKGLLKAKNKQALAVEHVRKHLNLTKMVQTLYTIVQLFGEKHLFDTSMACHIFFDKLSKDQLNGTVLMGFAEFLRENDADDLPRRSKRKYFKTPYDLKNAAILRRSKYEGSGKLSWHVKELLSGKHLAKTTIL